MFGSGAGYIGSDSGSQLGNFMSQHSNKRNVVLLDEFDHCNAETWEAFYHVFEEGEYVLKKVNGMEAKSVDQAQTRVLDCSRTVWLLTTNVFDNDIVNFNDAHAQSIKQFKKGNYAFDTLQDKFEAYIR
jgi:ATP-dependent Clp protease ATP-binding subunit ClpA